MLWYNSHGDIAGLQNEYDAYMSGLGVSCRLVVVLVPVLLVRVPMAPVIKHSVSSVRVRYNGDMI